MPGQPKDHVRGTRTRSQLRRQESLILRFGLLAFAIPTITFSLLTQDGTLSQPVGLALWLSTSLFVAAVVVVSSRSDCAWLDAVTDRRNRVGKIGGALGDRLFRPAPWVIAGGILGAAIVGVTDQAGTGTGDAIRSVCFLLAFLVNLGIDSWVRGSGSTLSRMRARGRAGRHTASSRASRRID